MMKLNVRVMLMGLFVLALSILPLPHFLTSIRPPWTLFLVLYIQFFLPHCFGIWSVFVLGVCLDVLLATALGDHAFALMLVTWIASTRVRRFHIFPLAQQMFLIALLCVIYQLTLYMIDIYQGYPNSFISVIGTTLLSILLWPWVSMMFEKWFNLTNRQRIQSM